jgi:hypothetical protein
VTEARAKAQSMQQHAETAIASARSSSQWAAGIFMPRDSARAALL